MIFLPTITDLNNEENINNFKKFNQHLSSGKQCFLFLYMDGCYPCKMTKLSWAKIPGCIKKENLKNKNVMVAEINENLFGKMKNVGNSPRGFPTLRYIDKNGKIVEEYESGRDPQDFADWIESKLTKKRAYHKKSIHNKKMHGGKWSMKYKKSIDCKNPKGFSQKQHCKYGRKKSKTMKRRI